MLRLERVRREVERVLSNRWITLRLDSWGIGLDGVKLVEAALCEPDNNIGWLNLYGNGLGDEGIVILAGALTHPHNKVSVLGLWDNNITDEGAIILGRVLENPNCRVTLLDLQDNNRITALGVKAIERAIKRRSCLETVMLPRTIEPRISQELNRIVRLANCKWIRIITCLLSICHVPRLGSKCSLKILPKDLVREIAAMMRDT